jgi:hypothetical protein
VAQRDVALAERNEYLRQRDVALGEHNEYRRQRDDDYHWRAALATAHVERAQAYLEIDEVTQASFKCIAEINGFGVIYRCAAAARAPVGATIELGRQLVDAAAFGQK